MIHCLRHNGLVPEDLRGLIYNPLTRVYALSGDTDVNYLLHARKVAP